MQPKSMELFGWCSVSKGETVEEGPPLLSNCLYCHFSDVGEGGKGTCLFPIFLLFVDRRSRVLLHVASLRLDLFPKLTHFLCLSFSFLRLLLVIECLRRGRERERERESRESVFMHGSNAQKLRCIRQNEPASTFILLCTTLHQF